MKKMFFLMLLLTVAGSMKGQEIPNGPKMVVTGNMVNTGALRAAIPVDLRTNADGVGQIDNKANGDIKTPALNVSAGTLLNNEGDICVGCGPTILKNAAKDYADGGKGDLAKNWIDATYGVLYGTSYLVDDLVDDFDEIRAGRIGKMVDAGDLILSEFVYSSNDSVSSKYPGSGTNAYADLSPLSSSMTWADAVKKCANLIEGGHNDWYLPNIGELVAIGDAGYLGYHTVASQDVRYRSSTEGEGTGTYDNIFSNDGRDSWWLYFNKNYIGIPEIKWLARCVRRI